MESDKADLIPSVLVRDGFGRDGKNQNHAAESSVNSSPMHTLPRLRAQAQGPSPSASPTFGTSPATSTPIRRSPNFAAGNVDTTKYNFGATNLNTFPPGSVASGAINSLCCAAANASGIESILSKGTLGSRPRSDSEHYYGEASVNVAGKSLPGEIRGYSIKQSKKLPYCMWFLLAKSLGIKLHPEDKPWFGTIVYIITLTFALTFAASHIWFLVYDIISITTRQTVLTGAVEMMLVIGWSSLGVYANKLAYKLFTNRNFVKSVRMHSKTIFKINSAGLMAILGVIFISLNNYDHFPDFSGGTCEKLGVNPCVCYLKYVARVGHSIFALIWNLLVGVVVLSVCRTHTIGIRRFIKELEEDGLMYIQYTRDVLHHGHSRVDDVMNNFDIEEVPGDSDNWDDMDTIENSVNFEVSHPGSVSAHTSPQRNSIDASCSQQQQRPRHLKGLENPPLIKVLDESDHSIGSPGNVEQTDGMSVDTNPSMVNLVLPDPPSQVSQGSHGSSNQESFTIASTKVELGSPRQMPSPESTDFNVSMEQEPYAMMPNVFTTEDILLIFMKIASRLRTTSRTLQRWLASWIAFVIFWSLTYIIYWLNHPATFIGIAEFVTPLLVLPLVCSAYAEVNFEGQRMLRCICPMENRLRMLYYINMQPLRMTLYGFAVSYQAILSVIGAVGIAFATKVILDELNSGLTP